MGLLEYAITIASVMLVVLGFFGLIGLVRVVRSLLNPDAPIAHPQRTRLYAMAATCVIAILVVVYLTSGHPIVAALGTPALLVSVHVIYLARHKLFSHALPSAA
jgi:hypothetical protein